MSSSVGSKCFFVLCSLFALSVAQLFPVQLSGFSSVAYAGETYERLQKALEDPDISKNPVLIKEALLNYHTEALRENEEKGKKTGNLRRVIYHLSTNPKKTPEFVKVFDRYGIEVFRVPPSDNRLYLELILKSLNSESNGKSIKVIAALKEDSTLVDPISGENYTENFSSLSDRQKVRNFSHLKVYYLVKDVLTEKDYEFSNEGRIDLSQKQKENSEVFGWDDIFVLPGLRKEFSYFELKRMGHKVSPRDMALSSYVKDFIYYKKMEDLNWHPVKQTQVIDFGNFVSRFVNSVPQYNNPLVEKYGIANLFHSVSNDGIFFRSPINRREKNYWLPGLNAGIPYTPKKDEIHELTYLAHDLGHFAIRDLIFTGKESPLHRQVYITYRMMSEAITMVFADMLFIDSLKQTGLNYDFSARKIYPLFQATGINFQDQAQEQDRKQFLVNLKKLMKANVAYCVRGDDSLYRDLLQVKEDQKNDVLEAFKNKYMPFMVEDFRWTDRNYTNMAARSGEIARWWETAKPLEKFGSLQFETIDDFIDKMKSQNGEDGDVVDQVFEAIFRNLIEPVFSKNIALEAEEVQIKRAFIRYMAGQFGIFSHYENLVEETEMFRNRVIVELGKSLDPLTPGKISRVRSIFNDYLNLLVKKHLITLDDHSTYSEIYPLFEPFFVSYDQEKDAYENLSDVSKRILFDSGKNE